MSRKTSFLRARAAVICAALELQVRLQIQLRTLEGCVGQMTVEDTSYVICIDKRLTEEQSESVLAHELRHVWQVEHGLLTYEAGVEQWMGEAQRDYQTARHEADANAFMRDWMKHRIP